MRVLHCSSLARYLVAEPFRHDQEAAAIVRSATRTETEFSRPPRSDPGNCFRVRNICKESVSLEA